MQASPEIVKLSNSYYQQMNINTGLSSSMDSFMVKITIDTWTVNSGFLVSSPSQPIMKLINIIIAATLVAVGSAAAVDNKPLEQKRDCIPSM